MDRREFLNMAGVVAGFAVTPGAVESVLAQTGATGGTGRAKSGGVPHRTLGRTGEKVSMIGVGGFHIGQPKLSDNEATRIIRAAIDNGVNFMDNSWDYNGGKSEERMGKALKDGYRQRVFLMTKIDGRTKQSAEQQLNDSLQRLQTDHLDLLQFHEVIRMNDPDRIFATGGALEAVLAAKKAGKLRYIGFTGHKDPKIHLHMLDTARKHNFHFDTVQMPLNVMDAHFDSFAKMVVPVAVNEGIGILGMKPMGDPFILKSNTVTPVECLHYAMNLPTSVVITGIDSLDVLNQDLNAARSFKPMDQQQVQTLLAKTLKAARKGEFELYKTSHHFDSTVHNPEWLG